MTGFAYSHVDHPFGYVPGRIRIDVPVQDAGMAIKMIQQYQEQEQEERRRGVLALPLHDLVDEAWAAPYVSFGAEESS